MSDFKVKNKARGGGKNNKTKSQAKKNKQKEVYNQKHIRILIFFLGPIHLVGVPLLLLSLLAQNLCVFCIRCPDCLALQQ